MLQILLHPLLPKLITIKNGLFNNLSIILIGNNKILKIVINSFLKKLITATEHFTTNLLNVPKYMIAPKARPKNIYQRISPSLNFSDNANINSAEIIQNIKSSTQVATVDVLTTLRDILNTSNNNATTTPAIQQRTKIPT